MSFVTFEKFKCSILIWRSECSCIISFNMQHFLFFFSSHHRPKTFFWSYINHFDFVWLNFASHINGYPCEVYCFHWKEQKKKNKNKIEQSNIDVVSGFMKQNHILTIIIIIERKYCKIDFSYHKFWWTLNTYACMLRWRCQRTNRMGNR